MKQYILCSILISIPFFTIAQAIDNTLSFKNINTDRYFRINYENDFFSATDIYYTQGIHIEVVSPGLKQFPLSKLLVCPNYTNIKYGIGAEHDGYTPTTIRSDEIQYGDRPFAACLFLKTFLEATDESKRQKISATLSTGLIGPGAGGKEMQTTIHRWLNGVHPHGWQYQISNDAILNYQLDYEKQLVSYGHVLSINADAMGRAGTLSDKAAGGFTLMAGYLDDPFRVIASTKKNFRIYAYEHPEIDIIGYDATLEGGVFDHNSPYTITTNNISRIVLQNRFGFVVQYQRVWLEYFQSYLSREFKTGNYHVWGGIQVVFAF